MIVLLEMAIHAMHSFLQMDVRQMHCFAEFLRVIGRHDFIFRVEQIPFSIAFVNRAKNPAVAVEIGELALL